LSNSHNHEILEFLTGAAADGIVRLADWHKNYQGTRHDIAEGLDQLNINRVGDMLTPILCPALCYEVSLSQTGCFEIGTGC